MSSPTPADQKYADRPPPAPAAAARTPMRRRWRSRTPSVLWAMFVGILTLFILAPLVAILGSSLTPRPFWEFPPTGLTLDWYGRFFTTPLLVDALWNTIAVAVVVGILGTALGVIAAVAIVRSRVPKPRLGLAALLPLLFPNVALGLALLIFLIETGTRITVTTLAVAQLVLVLPFTIRVLMIGAAGVPDSAERAAINLGASPVRTFFTVTLPSMRTSIVAAFVVALVVSLDDAAVALFVNTGRFITLPVRLLFMRETEGGPLIAAGGSVLLVFGVLLLVVMNRVAGLGKAFGIEAQPESSDED